MKLFRLGPSGLIQILKSPKEFWRFLTDFRKFKIGNDMDVSFLPVISDFTGSAGIMSGHYFHQDLLVAQKIYLANPKRHLDVGSSIEGFVAHVASFRPIEIIDIRNVDSKTENITFFQADLMYPSDVKTDSLSCLHTLEHFGLGRYGDPIDPDGHIKGFRNLVQMVDKGGTFYISFPIGSKERVEFNAHRVFNPLSILAWPGAEQLSLVDFAFVDDSGDLHTRATPNEANERKLNYGCGIYTFIKN